MYLGGEYWRILSLTSKKEAVFLRKDRRKHPSQRKRFLIFLGMNITFLHRRPYHGRKVYKD